MAASLSDIPEELIIDIISRVGRHSVKDLFNFKLRYKQSATFEVLFVLFFVLVFIFQTNWLFVILCFFHVSCKGVCNAVDHLDVYGQVNLDNIPSECWVSPASMFKFLCCYTESKNPESLHREGVVCTNNFVLNYNKIKSKKRKLHFFYIVAYYFIGNLLWHIP